MLNVIDKTDKMLYAENKNLINQFKSATSHPLREMLETVRISSKVSKHLEVTAIPRINTVVIFWVLLVLPW